MKVGDKEIVFHDTFIIGKNETLDFEFSPTHPEPSPMATYNKVSVNVRLRVAGSDDAIKAEWGRDNGHAFVAITLPEVKDRLGPAILREPIKIGQISGKNLAFRAALSSAADSYLVTLQFLFGGNNEQ